MSIPRLTAEQEVFERDWVKRFFLASDALDVPAWTFAFYKEDASALFLNSPLITPRATIEAAFTSVVASYSVFKHDITRITLVPSAEGGMIFLKGVVSYVLKDDPEGQILYVNALAVIHKHLGVGEERIDSIEIAADLDPVRVRAGEVMALLESKAMAV